MNRDIDKEKQDNKVNLESRHLIYELLLQKLEYLTFTPCHL